MSDAADKRLWLSRVLGIKLVAPPPPTQPADRLERARLTWSGVRLRAVADIGRVRKAVADRFADDEAQQEQLRAALDRLDNLGQRFDSTLDNRLRKLLDAPVEERLPMVREARETLRDLMNFIATDPLMAVMDGNEALPDIRVTGPLKASLKEIASALS